MTRDWTGKRYWLVGASEGLGAALAHKISSAGAEVIVSARSEDRLKALVEELPGKASYQVIDVSDPDSVAQASRAVGEIDGFVYLAAVYWQFGAQDWNPEHAEAMTDVNYAGLVRVLGQVVPGMVARDSGHIMITGSLTGFRGLPGTIGYTASKAAAMSLAECLYADLRRTGVTVQIANPGFIKTRLTEKNDFRMPFIMPPETAAREMFEHMNTDRFKKSFPTVFSWLFRLSQFLPDWAYYRLFA